MSIELFTLLMFASFFVLMALGVPIAFTLGGLAIIFGFFLQGNTIFPWVLFRVWDMLTMFSLVAVPLFVFMANMLRRAGIADDLYDAIYVWMGPLRGGLAIATVAACTVLAAMIGTAGGGIVIMGLIALPFMLKRGYDKRLACGSIMAGGSLGVLIPPSIMFIIYGTFAGVSIGRLFIGGVIPGLILSSLFSIYIVVKCQLQKDAGPALAKEERGIPLREKLIRMKNFALPVLLILGVLGSIYLGVATPAEAAGVGALGAIFCALVIRRLTWHNLKLAVIDTVRTVAMIYWVVLGAFVFVGVFTLAGGAAFIKELLLGLGLGRWGLLIVIQLGLILLGMVMDPVGLIVLAVPILVPLITSLGFDPLWFGILYNLNMQIGYLSPPFGLSLFYLKGVAPPSISMTDIYRSALPFMVLQGIGLALVIAFPQLGLWLPSLMIR